MSDRAGRLESRLAEAQLDALVVTNLVNLRYLTGFTGTNGVCVVGAGIRRFLTDFRYRERAAGEVSAFDREEGPRTILESLAGGWPGRALRVGFEDQHLTVRAWRRLGEIVPSGVELVPAGGFVEAERAIKEPGELQSMRAAASLADEALSDVLEHGILGRSERDVARAIVDAIRRRGGEAAFPPIVASGANGALPHAEPRTVEVQRDALVTIDWGAQVDGYCSDCTRTFSTGSPPAEMVEIHRLVLEAQLAGLDAVAAGRTGREVDAAARAVIGGAGHGEHFGHGLGHGVGLEVHEDPRLTQTSEAVLEPGNVVTVEPGVYVPGFAGVRIEDLVAVTADGREVMSGLGKELSSV